MKTLILLFIILYSFTFAFAQSEGCSIKTDGIYYAELDSTTNIYIKFGENDSVVTTSSDISLSLAANYIKLEHQKMMMAGKYQTNTSSCMVQLKAKNDFGKVKMEGLMHDEKLVLTVINMDDNTSMDFIFKFYKNQ